MGGTFATCTIPIDPDLAAQKPGFIQASGQFKIWGGTVTCPTSYNPLSGTYAGDSSRSIILSFTASVANPVIAWGGHIASQFDWGAGASAVSVSGSPYHMRILSLDGSGGNQDRALSASAIVATAPNITTQVCPDTGTCTATGPLTLTRGESVKDTATFTGANGAVTGTAAFFLCGPTMIATACTTGGSTQGSGAIDGTGKATSATFSTNVMTATGWYCYRVEYTPGIGAPYTAASHTNATTECFNLQAPNLTLTKTPDNGTVTKGSNIEFTLTVTNAAGAGKATGATLTDQLPTGFSWTVGGTNAGDCTVGGMAIMNPVAGGTTITCSFGDLTAGQSKTITLTAPTTAVSCSIGTVTNTAVIGANSNHAQITDNGSVTVNCPDVGVVKAASSASINAGDNAAYNITVTASGTGASTNVVLTDTLPSSPGTLNWTVGGANAGSCTANGMMISGPVPGGTLITCSFGDLTPGTTRTISLTAMTGSGNCGTISNSASVTSGNDTDTSNNSAQAVTITVNCYTVIVLVCKQGASPQLHASNVTVDGAPAGGLPSLGPNGGSPLTDAQVCGLGGAAFQNKTGGAHTASITIP
jgi:uncharacterized repeat protein (TIGR01451 family)/fimbrial isopeptide formation D2 family protein